MRQISFILLIIASIFALSLSSCSTSQTFTVQGIPGTVITNPKNQHLAVIDNIGKTEIKLKRKDGYIHFLQAQAPGSSLSVPFALDYKDNGKRCLSRGLGQTLAFMGGVLALSGSLSMLIGGESAMTPGVIMTGAGGALAGLGFALGAANLPINYDYDYLKIQTTNSDILK